MPSGVGYPPDLKSKKGPGQGATLSNEDRDLLKFLMASVKLWCNTTQTAREKFRRDFDYAEGNGKQWSQADRTSVAKSKRPALEFNQILPQVELVTGIQRSQSYEYIALPRGLEDRRLGEIVSTTLKAAREYIRLPRINAHVFDDATICGLGVWRTVHTIIDAKDILWGDIECQRINPLAFLWDPYASVDVGFQDGSFMGDASWMPIAEFKKMYPTMTHLANPGEWINRAGDFIGDSSLLGMGPNLERELYDHENGQIRILTMWYKKPVKIKVLVNLETGQVNEVKDEVEGERQLSNIAQRYGQEAVSQFQIMNAGSYTSLLDPTTGAMENFMTPEDAQVRLGQLSAVKGMEVYEKMKVITREARVPYWCEMVWGQILEQGKTPYKDRQYPYVPYVSRMLQDDPESIMGIVRNLWDPQDEYNKRYSNLLAHANSSSHSGWLNRKAGGANSTQLQHMGSTPGVVVEYAGTPPVQIKPVEMSSGHFGLIQHSQQQILRISGVNAEMVGSTTQKTVSGRAIKARQEGGNMLLQPRLFSFEEAQLDLTHMLLSRIQQYYPPQKIKRIIGLQELAMGGMVMPSVFADPVTGQPLAEEAVIEMIIAMSGLMFDLSLKQAPTDPTQRQMDFEKAIQLAQLVGTTGRPIGPMTMQALVDMAEMPTRFAKGIQMDMMMPPTAQPSPGDPSAVNQNKQKKGGHADGARSDTGGPGPTKLNQEGGGM
jgi:hypothetical protein